jgi:plasmid stabilization system protein ParE
MPPLTLRPVARAEIDEAYHWYEERRAGLGEEFLAEVRRVLASVEETPRLYPVIRKDVRRALLRRFPYSILYLAEPEATVVLGCFHGSRDPRRWHRRR